MKHYMSYYSVSFSLNFSRYFKLYFKLVWNVNNLFHEFFQNVKKTHEKHKIVSSFYGTSERTACVKYTMYTVTGMK